MPTLSIVVLAWWESCLGQVSVVPCAALLGGVVWGVECFPFLISDTTFGSYMLYALGFIEIEKAGWHRTGSSATFCKGRPRSKSIWSALLSSNQFIECQSCSSKCLFGLCSDLLVCTDLIIRVQITVSRMHLKPSRSSSAYWLIASAS